LTRVFVAIGFFALLSGCALLPRGSSFPKTTSIALAHAEQAAWAAN
jgi:hypothetical protein